MQFFDSNGDPLSGGKVYTYTATGTFSVYKSTFTTAAGDVAHPNPIILNASGIPTTGNGSIWLNGTYDIMVTDANDIEIESTLSVTAFTTLAAASTAYFESFSGNGSQTVFTTSTDLGTDEKSIMVWVDAGGGAGYDLQNPSAYTISGTSLTFVTAPASGTSNVYVSQPSSLVGAASSAAAAASDSAAAALLSENNAATSETNAATSESNAATSESNAATSETNAATSAAEAVAAVETISNQWDFDSTTTMGNPSSGDFRLNNATIASATQIAISATTKDSGAPDLSSYIATWGNNVNASGRGTLVIKKATAPEDFALFTVNGAVTDNSTWLQVPVAYVTGSGTFSNTDDTFISFVRSGTDGAGTGTVTSIATGDGLTGGTITDTGTISLDINGATSATVASGDEIAIADVSDSNNIKKTTAQDIADLANGTWELIDTQTASASVNIDFTTGIDSTYGTYVIKMDNVDFSLSASTFFRVSTDGGSNFLSTPIYNYMTTTVTTSENFTAAAAASAGEVQLIPSGSVSCGGFIFLHNLSSASLNKVASYDCPSDSSGNIIWQTGQALIETTTAVNAIRIFKTTGNITSGTFKLYGIR